MQYQVNPTDQTRENGQKPPFWLFGSFKNAFLMIFEWSSMMHIMAKLLRPFSIMKICNMKSIRVTKPKIWTPKWMDHSKQPTRRTKKNSKKSTRNFPNVQFSQGFHQKSEFLFYTVKCDHSRLRFPSKCARSWKTLKNCCFWHCIVIIEWFRFFPGNPAVWVFLPYHPLTSYQVSSKSLQRFSGSSVHRRTDGQTNIPRPDLNWSWEL